MKKIAGHKLVNGKWVPFYYGDTVTVGKLTISGKTTVYSFVVGG